MEQKLKTRLHLAIFAIIVASFLNAMMGALVKYYSQGLTVEAITFWRNLVCLVLVLPWLLYTPPRHYMHFHHKIRTSQLSIQFIRSLSGLAAIYFFFIALKYLSLANATLLANTIPIFIPITAYVWKKIPIIHRLWWGLGTAFAGIVIIIHPGFGEFHPAIFAGLAGSICGSIAVFALRLSHYSDPPVRTLFYFFFIASIVAGLITLFRFSENWHVMTSGEYLVLISLGCLALLYQLCVTFATKWGPVRLTSSFMYLSVVFSMLLQWLVWDQPVPFSSILGFLLVFAGAITVVYLYPKEQL